jgi:hypothetical protein
MSPRLAFLTGGLALFFGLVAPCHAQFYAPDTECHDRAQRRFIVEFSRVLAWRQNQRAAGPKVAEVTFTVSSDAEHKTTWNLRWLDANGKTLREDAISYPEAALAAGPSWYRDAARQLLRSAGSSKPPSPLTEAALVESFWKGADSAEPSRADSLRQAFALAPEKEPARLAGLLAQAALPSVGYRVSLDGALLARAAAWLCLAEQSVKAPGPKLDALWAPILFLSGREFLAADLWKKSPPPDSNSTAKWWGFMLSRPSSREVFAAAADPQYRRWALPMLTYESLLLDLGVLLDEPVARLFADEKALAPWHDYGPFLQLDTSISGDRLLAGQWPALSRSALAACLRQFKPGEADFHGYADALAKINPATDSSRSEDPSLAGWSDAAPLIDLGYREGLGKLTPVAVVTARDLLNYGWESSGLQMGARWKFFALRLGARKEADAVAKAALRAVDGSEVFFVEYPYNFQNENDPPPTWDFAIRPHLENFARLQEIGGPDGAWVVPYKSFHRNKGKNALLWVRRCWLLPDQLLNQSRELYFSHLWDDISPTLLRMHREGGPRVDNAALRFYAYGLTPVGAKRVAGSDELRVELLKAQTETSVSAAKVMQVFDPLPPFESAQRLEKIFWQRPGNDLPYGEIFADYLRAHAYASAKRFYSEAEPFLDERAGFANGIGARRFTLALLEGDRAAMDEALKASASGSAADLVMHMMLALSEEDYRLLEQRADIYHDYYQDADPKEDMALKLKGFLPLVPAFKNPKHPDHAKALNYFGAYNKWPTLQWVFVQKAKLSTEEAIRFLGGKDTDLERRLLVAYLLKDKELFSRTYDELAASYRNDPYQRKNWSTMAFVLIHWLRNDLLGVPVPAEQPDLKPPGVRPLLEAFTAEKSG